MSAEKYFIKTLGCKANLYDSQLIETQFKKKGLIAAKNELDPDLKYLVVNSCTVTDEADKQSKKTVLRASKSNANLTTVMTGCSAEAHPETLLGTPGLNFVIGNRDKNKIADIVLKNKKTDHTQILGSTIGYKELISQHPMDRQWPLPFIGSEEFLTLQENTKRTRAFLKIQEGCNSFCTFCIIPYGRGPARSLRPKHILDEIKKLSDAGFSEVVLTGTNLGDYGKDFSGTRELDFICEQIIEYTSIKRLRLSSLDPTEISERLIDLMTSEERVCPHFHVSLQSPHSKILRLMKRGYGFKEVEECLIKIDNAKFKLKPFVGMDLISGFPGETQEDFDWGVQALSELPWSRLHVFPYSERSQTPATRLPKKVEQSERVKRTKVLSELSLKRLKQKYDESWNCLKTSSMHLENVLLEGKTRGPDGTKNWIAGYTPNYLRVLLRVDQLDNSELKRNQNVSLMPTGVMIDLQSQEVSFLASTH